MVCSSNFVFRGQKLEMLYVKIVSFGHLRPKFTIQLLVVHYLSVGI